MRLGLSSAPSGLIARLLGIALCATTVTAVAVWPVPAVAQSDDEDEEDEGDDDEGDDEGAAEEEEDEEEEDPKDQPPITAGGLFTLKTYPVRELERPLTITEKILQVRAGIGVDISNKGAFESVGVNLETKYGFRDHVMGIAGLNTTYNFQGINMYAGLEAALAYDLIDFRVAARLGRLGFPIVNGEDVTYDHSKFQFSIDVGFPFRYVATKEIAIIALDTLMSIDFNAVPDGTTPDLEDGGKPDLAPSLGISTNPIAPVSIVLFAQLNAIDFDLSETEFFRIPATARIQFSPNQKLDLGLEFSFLNMNAPDPKKFYDDRFLLLYAQLRVGR
jgi:hypothetical protein